MAAERTLVYFVSDVHLGLDVNDPADREARFVRFLDSIPRDRASALYLLGDIWDFWDEYKYVVPKGYVKVFASLTDLMEAGVKVYFFQGNHDIWCYHYFEELGMTVLQQPHLVEIGGKTFCIGHGDGLGPGNRSYKIMRSIFRNRFCQWMFSTFVHPTAAFALARRWSRNNRVARNEEYVFKGQEEPLYKFALEFSESRHVDYFIFGHFHVAEDMTLPTGARLLVLKDWMKSQSSNFILFDAISGCLGISQNIE